MPIVIGRGMDPMHSGIVMIGQPLQRPFHPPVCTCLFLDSGLGNTTNSRVVSAGDPLFIVVLLALTLVAYWPWLSLALPRAPNLL